MSELTAEGATEVALRYFECCGNERYHEAAELCAPKVAASLRERLKWDFEPPPPLEVFRQNHPALSDEDSAAKHAASVTRFWDDAPFKIAGVESEADLEAMSDTQLLAARLEAIDPFSHYRFDYRLGQERHPAYAEELQGMIDRTAKGWEFEHVGTLLSENGRAYVLYFPPFEKNAISDTHDPNPHQVILRPFEGEWRIVVIPLPHARIVKRRGGSIRIEREGEDDVFLPIDDEE